MAVCWTVKLPKITEITVIYLNKKIILFAFLGTAINDELSTKIRRSLLNQMFIWQTESRSARSNRMSELYADREELQ